MKKIITIFLIALLIGGLFISCDSNVSAREDFAYVKFSASQSKELDNQIEENPDLGSEYAIEDVYWFYTAEKTAGRGTVGQTSTQVLINANGGLEGTIGPFSAGTWVFKLYGYADKGQETPVYEGVCTLGSTEGSVYLERQDSDSTAQTISVALKNVLTIGTVNIKDTTFYDGSNGTMLLSTTVYKEDTDKTTTIFSTETAKSYEAKLIEEGSEYASLGEVGTYIYEFNMFDVLLSSANANVAREVKDEKETDTIIWSDVPEGVYRIVSYLWYDADGDTVLDEGEEIQQMYDNYVIVYPREVLTISGEVEETTSMASVKFNAEAVARLDHYVSEDVVHRYWFGSLQDAINYGHAGDTIELLNAPGITSLVVNRPVKLFGPTKLMPKFTSISSVSEDLIVYTSYVDGDNTVYEFISDSERIGELMNDDENEYTIYYLAGSLPITLARNAAKDNVVVPTMQMLTEMISSIDGLQAVAMGVLENSMSGSSESAEASLSYSGSASIVVDKDKVYTNTIEGNTEKYGKTTFGNFVGVYFRDMEASLELTEKGKLRFDLSFKYIATEETETPNEVREENKNPKAVMVTDIEEGSEVLVEYSIDDLLAKVEDRVRTVEIKDIIVDADSVENDYRDQLIQSVLMSGLLHSTIATTENDGFAVANFPLGGMKINASLAGSITIDANLVETAKDNGKGYNVYDYDIDGSIIVNAFTLTANVAGIEASVSLAGTELSLKDLEIKSDGDNVLVDGYLDIPVDISVTTTAKDLSANIKLSELKITFDDIKLDLSEDEFDGKGTKLSIDADLSITANLTREAGEGIEAASAEAAINLKGFCLSVSDVSVAELIDGSFDGAGKIGLKFVELSAFIDSTIGEKSCNIDVAIEDFAVSVGLAASVDVKEEPKIVVFTSSVDVATKVSLAMSGNGDSISGKAELSFNDDALLSPEMQLDISDAVYSIDITEAYINGYSVEEQIEELIDMMLKAYL